MDRSQRRVLTKQDPLEEEMATTPVSLPREPINSMKRQKDMIPEDKSSRSEGIQPATGEKWRATTNSSRKNEAPGPKEKGHSLWICLVGKV